MKLTCHAEVDVIERAIRITWNLAIEAARTRREGLTVSGAESVVVRNMTLLSLLGRALGLERRTEAQQSLNNSSTEH